MFREVDTIPAAAVNLMAVLQELSPIVQIQAAQVQAQAAVQVQAAALPAVDLPL